MSYQAPGNARPRHISLDAIRCGIAPAEPLSARFIQVPNYYCTSIARERGKNFFHCHDKSLLLIPSDLTPLSIYDPTPNTVTVRCSRTTAAEASSYPPTHGPNAEPRTPLQSHPYPYRHLRRSRDSDEDNDNDRDLRLGRLRLSETRTTVQKKKGK